jgi:ribosomal protein L18
MIFSRETEKKYRNPQLRNLVSDPSLRPVKCEAVKLCVAKSNQELAVQITRNRTLTQAYNYKSICSSFRQFGIPVESPLKSLSLFVCI